ncbi:MULTISPECIES: hypothetical protein [Rahnella]|uniref:hypothetical protein n=1 Tax=Rahnella TaxID=34037 RepID=UPI0018E56074|nr:hypothetical protein [Rahnella sp. NRRL B-41462]CAH0183495.1 hypothetical protein SRABI106_01155 [Rahnella aquatilis]
MNERISIPDNGTEHTIAVSVKGVRASVSQALEEVSASRGTNKSALMRELINGPMSSIIKVFCLKSPLVTSLDQELAAISNCTMVSAWYDNGASTLADRAYVGILNINNENDLRDILLRNTPYLRIRAQQALVPSVPMLYGVSLYFALFTEIAGRDDATIEAAWADIFSRWGTWYRRQDYYRQINEIRAAMNRTDATFLTEAHAEGYYSRVAIFRPDGYGYGAFQVTMILDQSRTATLPEELFSKLAFPFFTGRIMSPDMGFGEATWHNNNWTLGFSFREGTCALHLYSCGVAEHENPVSLSEVARGLADLVDEKVRGWIGGSAR